MKNNLKIKKSKHYKMAVVNIETKEVVSQHMNLRTAMSGWSKAGLNTHEIVDI